MCHYADRISEHLLSPRDETGAGPDGGVGPVAGSRRPPAGRSHPLLRIWAAFTGVLFFLFAAWSLATPIGAIIDEPAQLVKAASVVRGEINGPTLTQESEGRLSASDRKSLLYCDLISGSANCDEAVSVVRVPQSFATFQANCYSIVPWCNHGLRGSGADTPAATYVGHYPPLYYSIVGLPSLVWHSDVAVYLMRLLGCLLNALFLGLALSLAKVWSRSSLLLLAIALAATPMVFIVGSVVNPSGLEVSTAICVWTGGLILVLEWAHGPPRSLVAATGTAAVVMVLTRGLSPLWLAIIVISLAVLAPRSLSSLIRCRSIRTGAGVVSFAGTMAVLYILWAHTLTVLPIGQPVPAGTSRWGVVNLALKRTDLLVQQLVGSFSWNSPLFVVALWLLSVSVIVALGVATSMRRHSLVILALIFVSVALPTVVMVSQAKRDGIVWQARDGFPLYVGILLVAGAVAGRNEQVQAKSVIGPIAGWVTRRMVILVVLTVAVAQLVDFAWGLRTYTVGALGTINAFARVPGGWSPPGSSIFLAAVATIATAIYCWLILRMSRPLDTVGPVPSPGACGPGDDIASYRESPESLSLTRGG